MSANFGKFCTISVSLWNSVSLLKYSTLEVLGTIDPCVLVRLTPVAFANMNATKFRVQLRVAGLAPAEHRPSSRHYPYPTSHQLESEASRLN